MSIEIEIVKSKLTRTVDVVDIAVGDWFIGLTAGLKYIRLRFDGDVRDDRIPTMCPSSGHVIRYWHANVPVYPCDADGNLTGAGAVEKVRADEIKDGRAFIDDDGVLRFRAGLSDDGVVLCWSVRIKSGWSWDGRLRADELVTPCTIKKIVVSEGVE